jgi:hypothetical protein
LLVFEGLLESPVREAPVLDALLEAPVLEPPLPEVVHAAQAKTTSSAQHHAIEPALLCDMQSSLPPLGTSRAGDIACRGRCVGYRSMTMRTD